MNDESTTSVFDEYVSQWRQLFGILLGWSAEAVNDWARQRFPRPVPPELLLRQPPTFFVADVLVTLLKPKEFDSQFSLELHDRLAWIIESVCTDRRLIGQDFDSRLRAEVERTLRVYGVSLS